MEVRMARTFSACEVVELGIQIEKNGRDFSKSLVGLDVKENIKNIFRNLAAAEEDHIKAFRDIFNASCSYAPEGAYPEEYFSYMNSLASEYVFTKSGEGEKAASRVESCAQGLDMGISFEKDSILFYQEMKKFVAPEERGKIDRLIDAEKEHMNTLVQMKEAMRG
jgi:rubrerythrin